MRYYNVIKNMEQFNNELGLSVEFEKIVYESPYKASKVLNFNYKTMKTFIKKNLGKFNMQTLIQHMLNNEQKRSQPSREDWESYLFTSECITDIYFKNKSFNSMKALCNAFGIDKDEFLDYYVDKSIPIKKKLDIIKTIEEKFYCHEKVQQLNNLQVQNSMTKEEFIILTVKDFDEKNPIFYKNKKFSNLKDLCKKRELDIVDVKKELFMVEPNLNLHANLTAIIDEKLNISNENLLKEITQPTVKAKQEVKPKENKTEVVVDKKEFVKKVLSKNQNLKTVTYKNKVYPSVQELCTQYSVESDNLLYIMKSKKMSLEYAMNFILEERKKLKVMLNQKFNFDVNAKKGTDISVDISNIFNNI